MCLVFPINVKTNAHKVYIFKTNNAHKQSVASRVPVRKFAILTPCASRFASLRTFLRIPQNKHAILGLLNRRVSNILYEFIVKPLFMVSHRPGEITHLRKFRADCTHNVTQRHLL